MKTDPNPTLFPHLPCLLVSFIYVIKGLLRGLPISPDVSPTPATTTECSYKQPLGTSFLTDFLGSHSRALTWGSGWMLGWHPYCCSEICFYSSFPSHLSPSPAAHGPAAGGLCSMSQEKWWHQSAPHQRGPGDMQRPPSRKSQKTREVFWRSVISLQSSVS